MIAKHVEEAAAGELLFDPAVARECYDAAEDWLSALAEMTLEASRVSRPGGFPGFGSAQQLADKFERLAIGDDGLRVRLAQFSEVAEQLKEIFRISAGIIQSADEDTAAAISKFSANAEIGMDHSGGGSW